MLIGGGATRSTRDRSVSLGVLPRGGALAPGAVVVAIPDTVDGEQSVCGLKAFLVDERRRFTAEDGTTTTIDCAKAAVLDIVDAPVHIHGETTETYQILAGHGRMLLGEQVARVGPGSLVVIPPGVAHGLVADDPARPVRVLMTFSPGMAPVAHQAWRDERILAPSAGAEIARRG
jgi:mannose-6-phosphate isomerase-like protein (cupin superfamily)